jgi:ribosomal-protein-alanine N-acetyltransferase
VPSPTVPEPNSGSLPEPDRPVRLVTLDAETLGLLLDGALEVASVRTGVTLTEFFLDQAWLWRIRRDQLLADPASAAWIARAAVVGGEVVGHVGFHGPPDADGMVEVAYAVDPRHRRRGHARAMLAAALRWAADDPAVRVVRASISPGNTASLATLAPFGFRRVGEQWDDEDGLELLYERPF